MSLWAVDTGKVLRILEGHKSAVTSIAFSPDGKTLTSGSKDYIVRLWSVETGRALRSFEGHEGWITGMG